MGGVLFRDFQVRVRLKGTNPKINLIMRHRFGFEWVHPTFIDVVTGLFPNGFVRRLR